MRLTRIVIDGVALLAAAFIVPGFKLKTQDDQVQTLIAVVVLAAVFGVINAYLRPVLRAVSLPINLLTMGLFGFFLNAGLLLLLAWAVDLLWQPVLTLGGFPPDFTITTLTAAVAGSLVITLVSTLMSLLVRDG